MVSNFLLLKKDYKAKHKTDQFAFKKPGFSSACGRAEFFLLFFNSGLSVGLIARGDWRLSFLLPSSGDVIGIAQGEIIMTPAACASPLPRPHSLIKCLVLHAKVVPSVIISWPNAWS